MSALIQPLDREGKPDAGGRTLVAWDVRGKQVLAIDDVF
jgi:hypothetical protein